MSTGPQEPGSYPVLLMRQPYTKDAAQTDEMAGRALAQAITSAFATAAT